MKDIKDNRINKNAAALQNRLVQKREAVFQRFPLLFTLLGAFGLVATFYGFEGVMDRIGLTDSPFLLLGIGIGVLVVTGTLYKKLGS